MSRYNYRIFYANKELNQIAFMSYSRGYCESDMISLYKSRKNIIEMPETYCIKYLKYLLNKFKQERDSRIKPFSKDGEFTYIVLERFVRNNQPWAFLPQQLIADTIGVSQKTVSRKIKDLLDKEIIKLVKRYKHFEQKANEYVLTKKGYKLAMSFFKKEKKQYKKDFFEFNCSNYVKLFREFFNGSLKEEPIVVLEEKPKHIIKVLYDKGYTRDKLLAIFPAFRERMEQFEYFLS